MRSWPFAVVLLASGIGWAVLLASFPPGRQAFPLFDDWAFARSATIFAQGGGIDYGQWAAMPQLGMWIWAFPFIKVFGSSDLILRISTILLSWLGLWAFNDLLRQILGGRATAAAFLTAALAFNPLFFTLSGTFMTDVPSLSFCLIGLAFYDRARRGGSIWAWLAALGTALLAVSTRQNAWTLPIAAAVMLACDPRSRRLVLPWLACAMSLAAGVGIHVWFQARHDVLHPPVSFPDPHVVLILPFLVAHLFGLTAYPAWALWPRVPLKAFLLFGFLLFACAGYWWSWGAMIPHGGLFPYWDGVFSPSGFVADGLEPGPRPALDMLSRVAFSVLGCILVAGLLARMVAARLRDPALQLLTIFTLLQVPMLLAAPRVYDRYLLFFFPGMLALAGSGALTLRPIWPSGLAALGLLAATSIALTHDLWSWNSARWALGQQAIRNISPIDIEGGFEWDGQFCPHPKPNVPPAGGLTTPLNQVFFPHVTGRYALSFSPLSNTTVIAKASYRTWLPPADRSFFLLKLNASSR